MLKIRSRIRYVYLIILFIKYRYRVHLRSKIISKRNNTFTNLLKVFFQSHVSFFKLETNVKAIFPKIRDGPVISLKQQQY